MYVCIYAYIHLCEVYIQLLILCIASLTSTMTHIPQQPFDSGVKKKFELVVEGKTALFKFPFIQSSPH